MTDINIKLLDITSASDGDVIKYVAANGTVEYGAAPGASSVNTHVVSVLSGSFYIDSAPTPTLSLEPGSTYKFDQSDSSNSGHPLRFSSISDGTHNSGTEYTTGVTYVGTPGSSGAYTQVVIDYNTPTLYYYCSNHSGMGSNSVVGNPVIPSNTTGNVISSSNGHVVVDTGSSSTALIYGTHKGDLEGTIRNSQGQLVLDNGSIGGSPSFGGDVSGDVSGDLTGNVISSSNSHVVIDTGSSSTALIYGTHKGDLEGSIRNSQGQLVLDNGSIGGSPSFGGVSSTVSNLSNHSIQAIGDINSNDTISNGDFLLYDNSSSHFAFVNFESEVNSYITASTSNLQIQDLTDVDSVDSLATGDILLYDNSSSQFAFVNFEAEVLAYVNASTGHNANDYNTYTTVSSLIDTVQANLTSVIGSAPTTLDTLAEIAAALENDANIAVTLTNSIGSVKSNVDLVQSNVTAIPDSAANDYITYTTLSGLIDTVQSNIVTNNGTANTWVNSNDHTTYTTVTANLYNTYISLHSDADLIQDNVNSLTSIVDSADANLYNTYNTVTGLIDTVQDNVGLSYSVYGSSDQFTIGTSNTFSLSTAVSNVNNIIVSLNGIVQYPTLGYEVSGSTLTLANTAPIKQGLVLEVRHLESGITAATWSEASSNTVLATEEKVIVDTSTNPIVLTLPNNPSLGNEVRIIDGAGNASNNSITLFGNGSNIEAESSNVVVDVDRSAFTLVYYNTYHGWLFGEK